MKVTIRIHDDDGSIRFKKVKIDDDGKITLRKRRKDRSIWRANLSGTERRHKWFGRVDYYADIFPEAPKTWLIDHEKEEVTKPRLTKEDIIAFGKWEALRARYRNIKDLMKTPTISYVICVLIILNIALTWLFTSGRLKL